MLNPVIVQIGFLQIRWYSLFYIIGLVIAYFVMRHVAPKRGMKLSKDDVMDYLVYLAMGLLIGGRIGYFLFYNISDLLTLEIFKLWHGGMSFHGGLVGAVTGGVIFCKRKGIDVWEMADLTVIPLGLALCLGRIGNFINGELYGRLWDGFLCVDYTQNSYLTNAPEGCRYPSQLAEAAKNLLIFGTMWMLRAYKMPEGFLFWLFVLMYGVLRFTIEFIRQPDPQLGFVLGPLTMGQILCSVMILAGSFMVIRLGRKKYK